MSRPEIPIDFWGSSDDTVIVEGFDEYGCFTPRGHNGSQWSCILEGEGGRLRVCAYYDGCWSFAAGLVADGDTFPDWKIEVGPSAECHYSMCLSVWPAGAVTLTEEAGGE